MVETWEQVKTKTQRKNLVDRAVRALERLVSSNEVKDLIEDVDIAERRDEEEHSRELYLNKRGLMEAKYCSGHIDSVAAHADIREWIKCDYENGSSRKVPNREFGRVVNHYSLTPSKITKIHKSLKN